MYSDKLLKSVMRQVKQMKEVFSGKIKLTLFKKVIHKLFQLLLLVLITMIHHKTSFAQESMEITQDSLLIETSLLISSFGVDENFELYVTDWDSGHVFRFTAVGDSVTLTDAFPNLNFVRPGFLTYSPDGTDRIFVLEVKSGKIFVFLNDPGVTDVDLFLDIGDRINISTSEAGLLGLAFHPDYANNGFFYVNYVAGPDSLLRTILARFSVNSANPNSGDPDSELILLEILNPTGSHFGGMIQFGEEGYLYIARGDARTAIFKGEVSDAQDLTSLLGKILRIDVDTPADSMNYGIPPDNPFVENTEGYREEIWASGLRNPWRFSIDQVTETLWVGDVGQHSYEEINIIEKGQNYGWNIMEGFHCFGATTCDSSDLTSPIIEYKHDMGCSVTGGYVYRGASLPELGGAYIYADFCTGKIWMLRYENVVSVNNSPEVPKDYSIQQNYPNPFNPTTTLEYNILSPREVSLTIYNLLGQEIVRLVSEVQQAGYHKVIWDASDFASGIYFYRLQAGDFVQTRKMVLLK